MQIKTDVTVERIQYNPQEKQFLIECKKDLDFTAKFVVWSGGMYTNPNEIENSEGCYIHYAHFPYMDAVEADEITIVGSANGASGVVMELARAGRKITLVVPHAYEVPQPIDCLWKEQMQTIADLAKQGLVDIVENFRVQRVYEEDGQYVLESNEGKKITAKLRPIVCIGFSPNIEPIKEMVEDICQGHEHFLSLDEHHQSKKQQNLYVAGCIGKIEPSEGMIVVFRDFGKPIADDIKSKLNAE